MMAERKDVSRCALVVIFIILNFMVKQKCFVKPDGISITFNVEDIGELSENFYYSSLFCYKSCYFKPKKHYVLFLLLLVCGDIESQPGPYHNIPELKNVLGLGWAFFNFVPNLCVCYKRIKWFFNYNTWP